MNADGRLEPEGITGKTFKKVRHGYRAPPRARAAGDDPNRAAADPRPGRDEDLQRDLARLRHATGRRIPRRGGRRAATDAPGARRRRAVAVGPARRAAPGPRR